MASRRLRESRMAAKYSSYKKYTASEDVSFASHSSRSSFKSESLTERSSESGSYSSNKEVISGTETRTLPVFIAIQDFNPEPGDKDSMPLEQGQIVEVLDGKNPASWLVRTKARPPRSGWIPGSYFETPTEYYKQRRRTREITGGDLKMTEKEEAIVKRDQVYHDLLRSEEDFVNEMRHMIENYVRVFEDPSTPDAIRHLKEPLTLNLRELYNFHANVLLKGLQYYSDDPGKVGQTFVRLERDFDLHVKYCRDEAAAIKLLDESPAKEFFDNLSDQVEAGGKTMADYLKLPRERMAQYQAYFKEFIKYTTRAELATKGLQKALELTMSVPQRANDMVYIRNIQEYPGDSGKLGRLLRHEPFTVWEGEERKGDGVLRYVFLFKSKLMLTERVEAEDPDDPPDFKHIATIRLDKYDVKMHSADEDVFIMKPTEPGLPVFCMRALDQTASEFARQAWVKDICETKEAIVAELEDMETDTGTEFALSDARSEFSEYSTMSRKSSFFAGPEEGPPRKKTKSPPVISPTGSSASLYSGSSSLDWTTTGTTLEMQGTRVTRTQYGFRTLQESSAKMCLKVTGYPLPDITWYKDEQLLSEDERHTFYADDDGFFAMTIDPVQVDDTGRYTCMATNEYGQASTSAFFRVLKVEKEPSSPKFVSELKDLEIKEGEIANFECEVEGWPEPELVWLVDDQPLRPSHDFKLEFDGQKAKLEIRDAQPEDTGTYSVRIKNEFGTTESLAKLTVDADPDKNHVAPEFQAGVEDMDADEGDTVRFKAVLTGDPTPEVTWFINGVPLSESDKVKFISEDGICIVTIKDVTRHFDGVVSCQAVNRLGTESSEARLSVRTKPMPPQFDRPLEDKTAQEKDTVVFEADVSGSPDPDVTWFIGGKQLVNGEKGVTITSREGGFHKLELADVLIDTHDGKEIICKAVNEHGQAESRARLTVETADESVSKSAPTFMKDITDQTVTSGQKATFETTVKGEPNPTVSWYVNGHKVDTTSPGATTSVANWEHKLTLDSTQYAGTVVCRAENAVGKFETKARLIVLDAKPKSKAPEFTEPLTDKTVDEGSSVQFEATAVGEPMPKLTWYVNGKQVAAGSSDFEIKEFNGSAKLEIAAAKASLAGEIVCKAENEAGTAETKATLTLTKKPSKPVFELKPKDVTTEKGVAAVFTAKATGEPQPTYTWSHGGKKLDASMNGVKIEESDGATTLTLDTNIFDSRAVSVVAQNASGSDEANALLTVESSAAPEEAMEVDSQVAEELQPEAAAPAEAKQAEEPEKLDKADKEPAVVTKPVIKKPLQDQKVQEGDLAHFEAVIENADTVTWYVNGSKVDASSPGVKISDEDSEYRITLDSKQYAGTVSCTAQNAAGSVETKAKMIVLPAAAEVKAPEFTDMLKPTQVTEGEQVKVDVIAMNSPEFTWTLKGKPLKDGVDGVKIINDGGKSTLIIPSAKLDDAGELAVKAKNAAGEAECSAPLTVGPRATAPEFLRSPDDQNVTAGEPAVFEAAVAGEPQPKITWQLNGTPIDSNTPGVTVLEDDGASILNIDEAKVSQIGEVVCTARNSAGTATKSAKLNVTEKQVAPQFTVKLTDRNVDEGDPIRMDAAITGQPAPKVSWYLNGKQLTPSDDVQMVDHGDGTYHLAIANAKPEMTGDIVCKAEGPAGSAESAAKINVQKAQKKPEFTKEPSDHTTTEDEAVKFRAEVIGEPKPSVAWYLNGKELTQSDDVKIKVEDKNGGVKTSVEFLKPALADSGTVTAKAKNSAGAAEASAKLTVEKKLEPPKFKSDMDDRVINEGQSVKYTVKVDGYPKPEITWFINGEKVGPSTPNVKISEDNGQHTIEISSATPEQTGEVACQATNAAGQAKKAARLKVNLVGEAPLFTKYLADQLVTEKELVLMEAKLADVKPKPTVSWFKDGKPLKEGDGVKIIAEADGTLKLQILQAQTEHGGRITIKAENHFGSAETSANIGIQKRRPQSKPQFLSQLTPINLNEGDTLQTKVLITGDPTPSAKWYINGQLVVQTEDTELTAENGVYSLTIHGVSADMTGKIKCVAYNKMGEAEISGPITVIAPIPVEFETSLCDATCREGDTLKLKAVLLGEPTPDVTWYINGKMLEESNKIRIHADKGTYTVTIKDITCDYSGKVVCKAVNEFGEASSEATLLVLPRGEPPDFLEWLSNVGALENSVVVHKVVYTGDPTPRLTWYINNEEIKWGRDDIHIETDGKTSTLTIKKFDPKKHAGEIICKAENDAGEVSCTANTFLRIAGEVSESESEAMAEDMIDVEMDNMTETGSGDEELPMEEEMMRTPTPVMAPRFITKIKDTKAKRHHQAIFECVVPDTKGVCCKWLKDGKEIELIARIRVKSRTIEGFTTNELIIDDVEPEDAGKYTVIVSNNAGQDTCEAKLEVIEVLEKPSAVAPDFVVKLADKTVSMGEKVLFECRVTGEPDPTIQWLADGKVVSSTQEGVRLESTADGTQRLIIDSVVITQAGKYVCVAENVAGKQETAAKLTVKAFEPRFTRELTTVSVTEKETAILECTVVGPPQPTVSFLLDGKQITTSDHVIVQSDGTGNWTLKIIDATEKDAGAYTAVATNAAGTAKSKADLNVKHAVVEKVPEYQEAPAFTQPLDEQNVTEGESAALECAVTGKPEPTVQWLKDGKPVQVDNSHVIVKASANGQHALTIVNAKQSDVGSYTCKAVNPAGEAETAAALHVQHATQVEEKVDTETAPVFVEELNEAQVQQGETAVLECRVKSQSTPEILWYRDDKPIKPDGQHLVVETLDNGKLKLTINSATKEDVGTYKCVAVAKGGKAQTAAKLDLKHAAQQEEKMDTETAPVFVEELNEAQVQQGETAVLECRVESQSTPEILWFCDDKPIKPDGKHVVVETLDNGKLKLTINSATKEDVGTYKCVAVAKGGKAQTAAKLDLKYAVQQEEAMEMEMAGGLEFVRPLQTITVPVGDEAILECAIASGVDDVQIAWSKDGGAVPKSAKVESKPDGTQRLTIGEARADDVGLYRCEANAAVGTAWTEGSLHVKAAATVSAVEGQGPPEFVEILHACDTVVDGEVKLKCKVKGAPAPKIRWLKDGKEVTMDARVKIESLPDGTQLLTVKKAAKEDIGEYRCEASNDLGAAWTEAPVSVKLATSGELPSEGIAPDFTEPIKAVEVAEGETAVLECKVVGEPAPEIKWFKGGEEIKPNDHFKIEAKPDGTQRLTIKNAKTDDIDEYRCEATNPLGSVWSDATLGVKLPVSSETDAMQQIAPTFVRTLEACDTAEGEEAAFECAIVGTPMPEIKWFKDNKEIKANDAHFKTEKFDDGTARLTIKEAVNADAGNFRCEATNPAGAARTDAPLTVHRAEESTMETEVAPEFLDDLRPVQADEGTAAVFECRVVGVPAPKVQWYKDGTPVKSGDGVVIEAKPDGTQRLKLDSAQVEDQGNYRCEATNPAGSMSSKAPLTVSVAEEMDVDESETAPEFTSPLQKCVAEEGAIAALECAVAGNVEKVTWYKDGKEVKPDNAHVKIESSPDGKQKLTILDAAAGDIGTYKCIVSNKVGEADTSGDLDVSATLKLKKGLEDQTLTQGSKLLLSIEVEGKPKTVKWYKGKDEIKASKTVKIEKKSESVYELVVDSAELSDSGSYKVVLSTETTSVDSSATVTVTEKVTEPTFKKGLSDKKVPKGSALALEIEVEGKPKSVKWFKDGKPIDGKKGKAEDLGDGKYRLTIPDVGDDDAGTYSVEVSNDAGTAKSEAAVKVGSDDKTPMMVRGLEDLTVKVGEKAVFEVEVSESVKVVKWYKNGKEVAASDRLKLNKVNEKKYQLAIAKATEDDTATYKVVLSNDAGSADSEASLTVKLPAEEPKFKKGLKDETVPVGAALQLEVEVTGKPKTVKWYKDGKEIGASAKIKIDKIDDNTYRLTIPSASPEDAGAYTVEIENEAGKAKSQGAVVVESTPEFLKGLEDLTVHVGEEVKFAVESSVVPKTIKWYKNGKEVKADNRVQLKSDDKKFQLVIAKAELTDAATYKVVLSNGAGDAESSAQLTVKKAAPGIPKIKKGLTDQNIPKGSPLTLSIEVEGEPTSVKWFKDGEEINPASTSAKIEKIGDNVYQLVIPSASPEDAGKYSVEVANDAGSAKSAGDVGVDEKPEIVKPLEDTTVAPGDDTILEVEVSAPPRVVKWYKNGREIKPDSRMKPKKIGDTKFQLAINRAQDDDEATYKVVLSNEAGSCDSEAALTVRKPAPKVEELKMLKGLNDQTLTEKQPLILSVTVAGKPASVRWYKNGQELTPTDRRCFTGDEQTGRFACEIPSAGVDDAGVYKVILSNEKGDIESEATVKVNAAKPKEESPTFLSPLEDVEVPEGDNLTLKCRVTGLPDPEIKWEKDGVPLAASERITMRSLLDGTLTLRILDCVKADMGRYAVVATNEAGSQRSDCKVDVVEPKIDHSAPKFVIPLSSASAPEGKSVTFDVKVRGYPVPELKWTRDGVPIEFDARTKLEDMSDGRWKLTINDVNSADAGQISCVASNEVGKDECSAALRIQPGRDKRKPDDEPYAPRWNVPLWDRRIPEHQTMSIECHVDAKPRADIRWTRDGEPLEAGDRVELTYTPDGKCRLVITDFTSADAGLYKCIASNELGISDTRANLTADVALAEEKVERKTYAPKFNPGLSDTTGKVGGTITLSCVVDAIPTANIIWYKDGLPLRLDRRVRAERDDDGTCRLIITDVQESDDGAYRCVASNEHGTTNTACLVVVKPEKQTVKKEGEEPYFTKGLVDCWVDRSTDFTLKCAVAGDPKPEIRWYKNGTLVRSAGRVAIEQQEDGTCTLTVKDCTMSDEGIYRCEAENKLGRAKTQATVHVQLGIGKVEKMEVDESEGPKFVIQLEDMSVSLDSTIELECKVTGRPTPTIKWSKDGGPLREDIRYTLESEASTGKHRLTIRNATVQDEGTYRCVATNDAGSATTRSFVRIDDGLGAKLAPATGATVPRFTIKLGDVRATEGQPLKLECKVEASPKCEFVWYKDGEKVAPSDRVRLEALDDGTARLIIDKCTPDDEGIYRVIATNPAGTAHDKSNAVVKRLPKDRERTSVDRDVFDGNKAPKVIIPLESEKIKEDGTISLKCKFSGDPKPTLKWFKDGERVYAFGRCQIIEHSDGTAELRIDNATRMEGGGYRCVAENDYGSARTTAEIVVQPKEKKAPLSLEDEMKKGNAPGFSVPLVVRRVREGETAVFECLPYGNPFPAIKWLKDGVELDSNENLVIEALEDGTQRLTVRNVDFFADGFYRCVATNEYGTASTKAELIIDGDRTRKTKAQPAEPEGEPVESKPRFRRGLYNFSVHQGNTIEMQVCTAGWPTPTVKWFKDDVELKTEGPDGRRIVWTDDLGIHRCVILNAQPEDEGEYSVVATNKLGTARTEGICTVIKPREIKMYDDDRERDQHHAHPPGFIRQLKNKHVFTNMPIIFDCLVVGHPPPEVEWFHNGKRIKPNDRIRIQASGGGSHSLIILKATIEDMGEYVAIAKNSQGQASSSAVLDVTAPLLDSIKFDGSIDVTPYLTEEYGFKKSHYTSIPTPPDRGPFIKEVTGHYLTLSWIPTKRAPPRYPQVTYVIEMRELPGKEWTLLDYNIPEPVCKVRNLELDKSYQFRVRAENIYGISDPSPSSPPSRLMAPPRPVMDKNKRIIPLLDPYGYTEEALNQAHAEQYACAPWFAPGVVEKRYCAENDTLTLTLNVSGYPDPNIAWKFRGWDVDTKDPLSKMRVSTFGGTETTLTVLGFSKDNVGQYQCIATNQYGDAQQNIFVDLAQRPNFLQPLMDKTFSSGKPLKLDVRVEGNPTPEIKWLKEWHPIVESSRIKIVRDGPYLVSLIINDPLWRDSGIYSCVAYNEAGKATTSCSVTVEADGEYNDVELPRKKVMLTPVKVREIYEIEEEVQKDAHGTVYRAVEVKTGRRFLARRVPLSDLDALHREIGVRNCLWHPNIAAMHDAIIDKDAGWLFFENATSGLLDKLTATDSVREDQVALFVRQLLDALQEMHNRKIVHLDLKPETILLKDDQIKLADFGQSRRLLKGKPTYGVVGSPEFVSPEIVNSQPVTLATDLWSVGSLSYVLLSGISPFLGDSDDDTLDNVRRGAYSLSPSQFDTISDNAKDFITQLLNVDPSKRPTVAEALQHPWMLGADSKREQGQMLSTDCLREFKYRHKWVERRVFVQQSATDEETHRLTLPHLSVSSGAPLAGIKPLVPTPRAPRAADGYSTDPSVTAGRAEPADLLTRNGIDYYDLLRVKERPRMETDVDTLLDVSPERPKRRMDSRPDSIESSSDGSASPTHSPAKRHADTPADSSSARTPSSQSSQPGQNERQNERRRSIEDELANRILSDISEENSVAGSVASIDELEPGGAKPLKEYRRTRDGGRRSRSRSGTPKAPEFEPDGGATPTTTTPTGTPPPQGKMPPQGKTPPQGKPSTLLVGPDGAVVGQVGPDGKTQPLSVSIDPIEEYYGDSAHTPKIPQIDDPNVPVGAPMVIEGLKRQVTLQSGEARTPRSPRTRLPPGTKSPVHLSPTKEETMEVIIATKRGKLGFLSSPSEMVDELDDGTDVPNLQKARLSKHGDDFDDLMGEVDRFKKDIRSRRTLDDDLDKYRPKAFYGDDFGLPPRPEIDVDDYDWESNYQIGPETYLLAVRAPSFNARVRDYRRELWGDGAPLVTQGILGYRNMDITVRERRRYTDVIKEDAHIAKSVSMLDSQMRKTHEGAIRRVRSDISAPPVPLPTSFSNADGTFAPVFQTRLKEVAYTAETDSVTLQCSVIGRPTPTITWFHNESPIVDDGRREWSFENGRARLTIRKPQYSDSGVYTCQAENDHGQTLCVGRLKMGDMPERPGRPDIELASDTELYITWEAPTTVGGVEVLSYRLEYRKAGENDFSCPWLPISDQIDDEAVVLRHLDPLGVYQYRVTAKNCFGWGVPSLTSRIVRTHPRGAPKLNLEVLRAERHFNVVSMPQAAPVNANGFRALGEIKEDEEEGEETPVEKHAPQSLSDGPLFLNTADDPTRRFQLGKEIYRGRFGLLRDAVDSKSENASHCVGKVLIATGDRAAPAHSEFDLLREGQHENVVQLIAAYERDGFILLFTERLHETIFERFTYRDYYNEDQIARSIQQLAAGIHWLQFKGIVHLDVQPDNVMFTGKRSWNLKLVDFGSAVQRTATSQPKPHQSLNVEFAAPELLDKNGLVTSQCDIWGLGIITFCLLSGFHPYSSEDDTPEEVKENVCHQKCDPNLIYTQASQESLRFVTWALKKVPARRMNTEEALQHRWLAADDTMTRRRENIKYPSSRLCKLARRLAFQRKDHATDNNQLLSLYGAK